MMASFSRYFGVSSLVALLSIRMAWIWEHATTPPTSTGENNGGLAEINTVTLGTSSPQPHVAVLRSKHASALSSSSSPPVLLMLHGGPGHSKIPTIHTTDAMLEEHFVVVHYDQRSAGKSCRYYNQSSQQQRQELLLTVEQHVEDALDMIQYLRRRFHQDKIYLLGFSWGTVLALWIARDYPQYLHRVGVSGTVIDLQKSETISYDFVARKFPEIVDKIAPPPYGATRVQDMILQRKYLHRAGGMLHRCESAPWWDIKCSKFGLTLHVIGSLLTSPEMSWGDVVRYRGCYMHSLHSMWAQMESLNAYTQVPKELQVPILFLHGLHDHVTAMELVPDYVEFLQAPRKKLVWFENSAHWPQAEEKAKFQKTVLKEFLDLDIT